MAGEGQDRGGLIAPLDFVHEQLASRVLFACGARARVAGEARALGSERALLIATTSARPAADDIARDLGDGLAERIDGVREHVPAADVEAAATLLRKTAARVLVAIGGGSAIGLAKAVAVESGAPMVAVPTTLSGSEVTPVFGITHANGKKTARDSRALPRAVVYDPELTLSLPPVVTATSGMNALAHCAEALYAPGASPLALLAAEEGASLLAAHLPGAVDRPNDLGARSGSLLGAWLGGVAMTHARMGLNHSLAHILGGRFGLPHAAVHSVLLPHVVAFNLASAPEAGARLQRALGVPDVARGVYDLASELGAPASLAAVGFEADAADEVARLVSQAAPPGPRPADEASVRALLLRAHDGVRPSAEDAAPV